MYAFEEHTSEVAVRIEAATLGEVFVEAARALAAIQLGPGDHGTPGEPEAIGVRARDRAGLLVAWLDELVFRSETEKCVFLSAVVTRCSDTEIEAAVRGVAADALRTAVKAATWHGVRVEPRAAGGYEARIILDV